MVWVEPWRVSVFAQELPVLQHMWVGAAVTEAALLEAVPLAPGRCAAAGVTGSRTSTWTLSSQRKWPCIWTLQAPPPPEGEEPGNETPPSAVMSSQTPPHTNATGWSDLLPAYVCEGGWGEALEAEARRGEGDGRAYVGQMDGQTYGCLTVLKIPLNIKTETKGLLFTLLRCWTNSVPCLLSRHYFYKSLICNQNTQRVWV